MKFWYCLLLICLCPSLTHAQLTGWDDGREEHGLLDKLMDLIPEVQIKDEPQSQAHQQFSRRGSYSSSLKFNTVGDCLPSVIRREISLPDVNAFFPLLITPALLEAYQYGNGPKPSESQLISTVDYVSQCMDKHKPYNTSVIGFWPMNFHKESQTYQIDPDVYLQLKNAIGNLYLPFSGMSFSEHVSDAQILKTMTTASQALAKAIGLDGEFIASLGIGEMRLKESILGIPPDVDDTFCWIGMASIIETMADEFPITRARWKNYNPNITSAFDALKKYAYRPFSNDPNVNTINPRTYLAQRGFLDSAAANGKDVALPGTWTTNLEDYAREYPGLSSNYQINDVCAVVSANVIYGITASILSGLVSPQVLEDADVAQIYHNTSAMLAYQIKMNFSHRQDLVFTYYTSRYLFYHQVARSLFIMENYRTRQQFPVNVMESAFIFLKESLEGETTQSLLDEAQTSDDGGMYYDDFLGNGDITPDNERIIHAEDRIFTTAVVANTFMATWLTFDDSRHLSSWKPHTPETVKKTVAGLMKWLKHNTLSGKFKPWQSAFKGVDNRQFWYPANKLTFKGGINVSDMDSLDPGELLVSVQGYIPPEKYEAMLRETHFGKSTPRVFKGYNDPESSQIIFWSSDAFTYAHCLLALARYETIKT